MRLDQYGKTAQPGARGFGECGCPIIAKCGDLNMWHWSHEAQTACTGIEHDEGFWQAAWHEWALTRGAETDVRIGRQRVDFVMPNGRQVLLRSEYPDVRDVERLETVLGDAVWIYRWTQARWDRLWQGGAHNLFKWRQGSRVLTRHTKPIRLHHHDRLFVVDNAFMGTSLDWSGENEVDAVFIQFNRDPDTPAAPFDVTEARTYMNERVNERQP